MEDSDLAALLTVDKITELMEAVDRERGRQHRQRGRFLRFAVYYCYCPYLLYEYVGIIRLS